MLSSSELAVLCGGMRSLLIPLSSGATRYHIQQRRIHDTSTRAALLAAHTSHTQFSREEEEEEVVLLDRLRVLCVTVCRANSALALWSSTLTFFMAAGQDAFAASKAFSLDLIKKTKKKKKKIIKNVK